MAGGGVNGELVVLGTLTVPGTGRSAAHLRCFAGDMLGEHPRLDEITLCLVEKFANAIAHTASGRGGRVSATIAAGGGLVRTEVADDGACGARPAVAEGAGDPLAEHGRGLRLLAALSDRWGYEEDGPRTIVWAEYAHGPASGNFDDLDT